MTTVQLFGDIGLYANYKKTIDFSTISEQNAWFNNKQKTTIQNVIYNKPYNSLKLNMQYGQAMQYSYARLLDLDTTGRIYYFFISTVNVIDDATVEFILEPDVIQTYMTYWTLGESMVNRAHVDRWSPDTTDPIRISPNKDTINAIYNIEDSTIIGGNVSHNYANDVYYAYCIYYDNTANAIKVLWSPVLDDPTKTVAYKYGTDQENRFANLGSFVSNEIFERFAIDPESVMSMGVTPFNIDTNGQIVHISSPTEVYEYQSDLDPEKNKDPEYLMCAFVDILWNAEHTDRWLNNIQEFSVDDSRPQKPQNNVTASDIYEPAMYMNPYRRRLIASANSIYNFEVPDNILLEAEKVTVISMLSATSSSITCVVGMEQETMKNDEYVMQARNKGLLSQTMMDTIDIYSDRWLTYALTQQAQDRQILNNQAISNVLQGMIFGSYGGALVSSRGSSGKDKGMGQLVSKMIPGIAIGGVASGGAALIDSHFAWQNQLLEEQKIQNQAQQINIAGTGGGMNTLYGMSLPSYVVMKCDDANYDRGYANYRKYGYLINEFTSLNIKSRKYYNYILTNGACIEGAIPEDARDLISQIFDSGVTIFHGDYCDTLEYPTYENIERSLIQ